MNAEYEAMLILQDRPETTNSEISRKTGVPGKRVRRLRKELAEPAVDLPPSMKLSGTYFLADGEGRVKIGHSDDIRQRIATLQTGCPTNLELLGIIDKSEAELHVKFAHYHYRGEWFVLSDEIKTFIENNCEVPT